MYYGDIAINDLQEAISANLSMSKSHGCRLFLVDCSGIDRHGSLQEMRELAGYLQHISADPRSKEALLLPVSQKMINEIRSYDFPSHGKHYQFDIFSSRRKAIAWLIS
jgi:hypothetical protein